MCAAGTKKAHLKRNYGRRGKLEGFVWLKKKNEGGGWFFILRRSSDRLEFRKTEGKKAEEKSERSFAARLCSALLPPRHLDK